jgi:hypothetical protein
VSGRVASFWVGDNPTLVPDPDERPSDTGLTSSEAWHPQFVVLPETRYAQNGDAHIAYQVVGDGGLDLVLISAWFSHVDARWEIPGFAHYLRRLAARARAL